MAINKQTAYLEFKESIGKAIEDSIIVCRSEMKDKRAVVKTLTSQINSYKKKIDSL